MGLPGFHDSPRRRSHCSRIGLKRATCAEELQKLGVAAGRIEESSVSTRADGRVRRSALLSDAVSALES